MKKPIKKRNNKNNQKPVKTIMSYLLPSDDEKENEKEDNTEKNEINRASLQEEYLIMIDKEYACGHTKINPIKLCSKCGIDKQINYTQNLYICRKCGESEIANIESEQPSHKDAFTEKPKYPYKKLNHLIEKLNQFQSKETANIPDYVYEIIDAEIKKHQYEYDKITMEFLNTILKKHRLSAYYEHIMFIYSKITRTPPLTVTREEQEIIIKMFNQAEETYEEKYKPKDRNNFLKYSFVLHKIFLILKKPEHAKHFKLLKSKTKLKQQEEIWKNICKDRGWDHDDYCK